MAAVRDAIQANQCSRHEHRIATTIASTTRKSKFMMYLPSSAAAYEWSANADKQHQVAASRRALHAGGREL